MLFVGTKALLAKVKGKSQIKPADCAASTVLTNRPMVADIHEKAKLVSRSKPAAANQEMTLPCGRKPTNKPTDHITMITNALRVRSERVRPVSTADFAIGNERKRSTSPRCRSLARPMPVDVEPKMTVWAKMPAIK